MSNILERPFDAYQGFLLLENAKNIRHKFFCGYDKIRDFNGPLCAYLMRQNLHNRTRPRSRNESANGDFPCAKLQNAKKNRQIFFADMKKKRNLYWLTY